MKAKNKIKMFAIIALVALVAVGSTLAYLSSVTETKENKFTSSKNLNGTITEENWEYGEEGWNDYMPGDHTAKDPVIHIDDDGVEAYVAMKVTCKDAEEKDISFTEFQKQYATVSYAKDGDPLSDVADNFVEGINPNWDTTAYDGFYIYKETVQPNGKTKSLFDRVTINVGIKTVYDNRTAQKTVKVYNIDENGNKTLVNSNTEGMIVLEDNQKVFLVEGEKETEVTSDATLPSFQINVTGYAIQKNGNEDKYTTELAKLAGLV